MSNELFLRWGSFGIREGWWIIDGEKVIPVYGPCICVTAGGGPRAAMIAAHSLGYKNFYTEVPPMHMDVDGKLCRKCDEQLDGNAATLILQLMNPPFRDPLALRALLNDTIHYLEKQDSEIMILDNLRSIAQELRSELENLLAMVNGECPSLLEDHHQFVSISKVLEKAKAHGC
jgi:hypothetical protein